MATTRKTRKPVNLLTPADFMVFPIREYADDEEGMLGRDEMWVRPVSRTAVPLRNEQTVARAKHLDALAGQVSKLWW
jgi:hypothetical protein